MASTPSLQYASPDLSTPKWSRGHILALDGLRGCAVLAVMIYHFTAPEMIQKGTGWMARLQGVFGVGWCGVDLFFVLSGFLITGILLDAKGSSTYFKSFYVRRVLRIFPLYYGVLLLVAVGRHIPAIADLFELNVGHGHGGITSSLGWMVAYVSNFVMAYRHSKTAFGPMGHFWSLAVEEHFYMIWPTLVFLCTRRQLAIACSCFVIGALALRCGLAAHNHTTYATYLITPCRVDGLALGGLLALLVRSHLDMAMMRNIAWGVGIFSFIGILGLGLRGGGGFSHYGRAMTTLGFSLFAFFFAGIMTLVLSASPGSIGRTILEWPPLRSVGKYSFAMYIFHLLFLAPFLALFSIEKMNGVFHSHNFAILAFALLSMLATYLLGFLSWHLYEQNFLRLKRLFPY